MGKFAYIIDRPMAELFDKAVLKTFRGKAKEDIKILDVAAGTGLIGVQLQKLGYTTLHALDSSQEMLNEAKKKNIYQRFFCLIIDGQQISEIGTGEYDALICASAFGNNHILPTALKEMCRIITKGSYIQSLFGLSGGVTKCQWYKGRGGCNLPPLGFCGVTTFRKYFTFIESF